MQRPSFLSYTMLGLGMVSTLAFFDKLDAQVLQQQSPPPASNSNTSSGSSNNNSNSDDNHSLLPKVDLGNETVSYNGQVWGITNQRLFRARLEKYLSAPVADTEEDQAYRKILSDIATYLSPNYNNGRPDVPKAVSLLPEAAQFDIDAKLCDALANAIYGVWLSQKNISNLAKTNEAMAARVRSETFNAKHATELPGAASSSRSSSQSSNNNNRQQNRSRSQNQGQRNSETLRSFATAKHIATITELETKIKGNEALMGTSELLAKAEYQALILQFAAQRRFEHVVLACRFYRNLFRDPNGQLVVKEGSDANKAIVSSLGSSPTISALDSFANEAIRDVEEAVSAFHHLLERGDLASASQRISEAFMLGEYLPSVRRLPMESKMKVLEFTRDGHQLLSAMEMKDYALAEKLVTQMRAEAKDFDYSKPLAVIETAKTASDMHLNKAKVAAMKGDESSSTKALTEAAQIWPTNPKLREFTNMIGENADIKTQTTLDLDRLISQKNYRQIFNDQGRYLAAVLDDPERQEKLKSILVDMNKLNLVIAAAESQAKSSNPIGAWETVEKAYQEFPDDPDLSRMRSDLSLQATEFVGAIQKAKTHESKKQLGSALSWYLKAKHFYPPSELAREGLQRQLEVLAKAR